MFKIGLLKGFKNVMSFNKPSILYNIRKMSSDHHHGNKPHFPIAYDDLPQPQGDFHEHYQSRHAQYNKYLAGSFLLFAITALMFIQLNGFNYHGSHFPKFENTPEGLAFYEYSRKVLQEKSDRINSDS